MQDSNSDAVVNVAVEKSVLTCDTDVASNNHVSHLTSIDAPTATQVESHNVFIPAVYVIITHDPYEIAFGLVNTIAVYDRSTCDRHLY